MSTPGFDNPTVDDEMTLMQHYLADRLAPAARASFEAYLITREPLIRALEQANDERDCAQQLLEA